MDYNAKGYHDGMAWIASAGGMNAALHPACARAHAAEPALCMFAPHLAPFIETPLFVLQAKYDAWQIPNILGSSDAAAINAFGADMLKLLRANVLNRPANAVFLDSCRHHCGGWDMYVVDGLTEARAFAEWYRGVALPNRGRLLDDSAYPCAACVCSFV